MSQTNKKLAGQIKQRKKFELELRDRLRQQRIVGDLALYSLRNSNLSQLMHYAVTRVAKVLDVEYCKILRLLPDGQSLLLEAGVGWKKGLVFKATVKAGVDSQAGFTLKNDKPIILEDLATETRFQDTLLRDHKVVSGLSVIIMGANGPYGALAANSAHNRKFTRNDVNFVQSVANLLSLAMARTHAEDKLRKKENELTDFVENVNIGLHWVGPDGKILWANRAELNMLGYDRDEYIGHHISEFHADKNAINDILTRLARNEELDNYEATLRCKDGSLRHGLLSSSVYWRDGNFIHTRCITRDITERRHAEGKLRAQEARLRIALQAGKMGAWEWDLLTGAASWNEGLFTLLGLQPVKEANLNMFLDRVHPEDRPYLQQVLHEVIEKKSEYKHEFRIIRPDGEVRWLRGQGQLILNETGLPVRMVGINYDVTEQRMRESKLSQTIKEKEVLLKEVHHRVKNNLQIVSSLLNIQARSFDNERVHQSFQECRNRIQSMTFIHEILYQSQNLAGIDFAGYIRNLSDYLLRSYAINTNLIKREIEVKNIALEVEAAIPCGLIINELISNSLKHGFPDEDSKGIIYVHMRRTRHQGYKLIIADDGCGLPNDFDIEKVKTIGLTLVRTLVAQLGGKLRIAKSGGTRFEITFRQ